MALSSCNWGKGRQKYKEYKRKYYQRKRHEMIEGYIKNVVNRK